MYLYYIYSDTYNNTNLYIYAKSILPFSRPTSMCARRKREEAMALAMAIINAATAATRVANNQQHKAQAHV